MGWHGVEPEIIERAPCRESVPVRVPVVRHDPPSVLDVAGERVVVRNGEILPPDDATGTAGNLLLGFESGRGDGTGLDEVFYLRAIVIADPEHEQRAGVAGQLRAGLAVRQGIRDDRYLVDNPGRSTPAARAGL